MPSLGRGNKGSRGSVPPLRQHSPIDIDSDSDSGKLTYSLEDSLELSTPDRVLLAPDDLPVPQFLEFKLPEWLSQSKDCPCSLRTSPDEPNADLVNVQLLNRPLHPEACINRLLQVYEDNWGKGHRSVIDDHFETERLPPRIIILWKELNRLKKGQNLWGTAWKWCQRMAKRTRTKKDMAAVIDVLNTLPWNLPTDVDKGYVTNLNLSRFLGTAFLTDGDLLFMTAAIAERLPQGSFASSQVLGTYFPQLLDKGSSTRYLKKVFDAKRAKKLYFPLNVNGNHWIAVKVDFVEKTISYGDSLPDGFKVPKDFEKALQDSLKSTLGLTKFKSTGNTLVHGVQEDGYSCGLVTANTIEHELFQDALWTPNDAVRHRLSWFMRLKDRWRAVASKSGGHPSDVSRTEPLDCSEDGGSSRASSPPPNLTLPMDDEGFRNLPASLFDRARVDGQNPAEADERLETAPYLYNLPKSAPWLLSSLSSTDWLALPHYIHTRHTAFVQHIRRDLRSSPVSQRYLDLFKAEMAVTFTLQGISVALSEAEQIWPSSAKFMLYPSYSAEELGELLRSECWSGAELDARFDIREWWRDMSLPSVQSVITDFMGALDRAIGNSLDITAVGSTSRFAQHLDKRQQLLSRDAKAAENMGLVLSKGLRVVSAALDTYDSLCGFRDNAGNGGQSNPLGSPIQLVSSQGPS